MTHRPDAPRTPARPSARGRRWVLRAADLAGTLLLLAGAVSVVRQRREAVRVRRGLLEPARAAAELTPVRPGSRAAERLAVWVPDRPRTRAGQLAAALWAAPMTAVGITVAVASRRRPRWDDRFGCFVATGVGGASGTALRLVGAEANTIGQVVLSRIEDPAPVLLAHEAVHVRQAERLGPALLPTYLWLGARYGYRDHPLERGARAGARAWRSTAPPSAASDAPATPMQT